MTVRAHIDIKENELLKIDISLLEILLQDKTTGKNLIWATDNYVKYGECYLPDKEIFAELITSQNGNIIKPRMAKPKAEQQQRVRQKAEVFTPRWICNLQNNLVDESWFGSADVFSSKEKIHFPAENGKDWRDYVLAKRLEIACGEAPYLASRYNAVTGEYIDVPNRIGLLDRKLRVVSENTTSREEWLSWAYTAVQSVYGFDWQGDNVLLARENILFTVAEHYEHMFHEMLASQDFVRFAKVIAWNIWQMDGLKFVVPNSCHTETKTEETLFETISVSKECAGCKNGDARSHNGTYCVIKDWETGETVRFVDMIEDGE